MAKTKDFFPSGSISGVFQGTGRGFGFLSPDGETLREADYFIPPRATGGAWDGDRVLAVADAPVPGEEGRRTASVVRILERANHTITGTLIRQNRELWLRPDSDKLPGLIKVTGKARGIASGEKAAVELCSYGTAKLPPAAALRETFGPAATREAAAAAILYHYEIDPEFPADVLEAAERMDAAVPPEALAGRLDLRNETIITIDGASAKDLDDAVSLVRDAEGRWVLGVHIADVSHYVTEKSRLDAEAWERGTSVYFADRVIPMLPPALSNGICSLNPRVDRLTLSCIMTMNGSGEVLSHSIRKSVIRTAERMTYSDCNALLEGGHAELEERYREILPMLRDMSALAGALERSRRLRGSLDLDSSESYIVCDEEGHPVDILSRKQGVSEGLIESFMLAANETVAKHLCDLNKPAVYRIHEKPSADKAEGLKTMLAPFGISVTEADSFSLQKILDSVRGKPEAPVVGTIVLRSMMKARYDVKNSGHFGLAAPYYCHFTSPIRRYPDLMVHRILSLLADSPASGAQTLPWEKKMEAMANRAAVQSSEREIAAQNAEREIEKLYMAEYMVGHLGEELDAVVSGVAKFGLFIMLPSGVEGFLPAEALPEDRYHCDNSRMVLRGELRGRVFTFGMPLRVVCVAANPGSGEIDFRLAGDAASLAVPPRPRRSEISPLPQRTAPGRKGGRKGKPPRHKPGSKKKR